MEYVNHPYINENLIENREYQRNVVASSITGNTLVVLPTGLGKTPIAILVSAIKLQKQNNKKILMLAPTRPLVEQHKKSFEKSMKIGLKMQVVTGNDNPHFRPLQYQKNDIIFSTPQTIQNDLKKNRLKLSRFSLIIFDEAHHCIGNYAYTYIAKKYSEQCEFPSLLALTASPGATMTKINEIKKGLYIENLEIKNREDEDVKPYVKELKEIPIMIQMDKELYEIRNIFEKIKNDRLKSLSRFGISTIHMTKTRLIETQIKLAKKEGSSRYASSVIAEIIKIDHLIGLLETQTLYTAKNYIDEMKIQNTFATKRLFSNEDFKTGYEMLFEYKKEHPKIEKLKEIIKKEISENKDTRIIIFAQYRDTIEKITDEIKDIESSRPVEFIGQKKRKGKSLTQKRQIELLREFELGIYNILVASQIAEEGLSLDETDLVIFNEAVPSAIRKIQRSGRTGRTRDGRVITLLTKDTRDEAYYWSGKNKESNMKKILTKMHLQTSFKK